MGKKLNLKEIELAIENNPLQMFDICSECSEIELHGKMNDSEDIDNFELICDECLNK